MFFTKYFQVNMKNSPALLYTNILNNIPPPTDNTSLHKHIHNHIASEVVQNRTANKILNHPPPPIHHSETTLTREDRVHLSRMRCGHHPEINSYKNKLDPNHSPYCPHCPHALHTVEHIFSHCHPLAHYRLIHNIQSSLSLWTRPTAAAGFLRSIGLSRT